MIRKNGQWEVEVFLFFPFDILLFGSPPPPPTLSFHHVCSNMTLICLVYLLLFFFLVGWGGGGVIREFWSHFENNFMENILNKILMQTKQQCVMHMYDTQIFFFFFFWGGGGSLYLHNLWGTNCIWCPLIVISV